MKGIVNDLLLQDGAVIPVYGLGFWLIEIRAGRKLDTQLRVSFWKARFLATELLPFMLCQLVSYNTFTWSG